MEKNKEIGSSEEMIWEGPEKGTFIIKDVKEIKDEKGKVIGKSNETYEIKTDVNQIVSGLEIAKEHLLRDTKELKTIHSDLKKFGEKPVLTSEQIILRKNFEILHLHNEIVKNETRIPIVEGMIDQNKVLIDRRQSFLDNRPKQDE